MDMRISDQRIKEIQHLMKLQFNRTLSDEEAQLMGLAVMQFVIAQYGKEYLKDDVDEEELNEF